jgi:hypothetical protein
MRVIETKQLQLGQVKKCTRDYNRQHSVMTAKYHNECCSTAE